MSNTLNLKIIGNGSLAHNAAINAKKINMGLNTKQIIDASFIEKYLTVKRMKEILNQLEDEWELLPNSVGNLSVFTPQSEPKGFIDIGEEIYQK